MKLGIRSAYFSRYGLGEGAKRMKRHGYHCVDYQIFVDTETDFFNLPERDFEKRLKEDRNVIEAAGITVFQTHGPWRSPQDATVEDRAERFQAMAKSIRGSAYLGAKAMVIHPLMPYGAKSAENPVEMRKINFDFFSSLCEVAREYGIVICYENMPFPLLPIHSAKHVADFAREINSDYFKVCLDTGHSIRCGEPLAEAVHSIGKDLLFALHVHDNDGLGDKHWLPCTGVGDWEGFSKALAEIGFDGVFSFETSVNGEYSPQEQERRERELALLGKRLAGLKEAL